MGKKKKGQALRGGVLATNRKARHDYTIIDTWEAGIALVGTEIKSLREGKISLTDAFATVDKGEVWLRNLNIPWGIGRIIRRVVPASCCCTVVRSTRSQAKCETATAHWCHCRFI